jgi:hypothetical protein
LCITAPPIAMKCTFIPDIAFKNAFLGFNSKLIFNHN